MSKINIIVIGNQGSGKTSVTNRFMIDDSAEKDLDELDGKKAFTHLYYPTIGINLEKKNIKLKDHRGEEKEVSLHIWDTAGQEKFFALTKNFFQRADGVAIIYDITDKSSFVKIEEYWINQIQENCKNSAIKILIGNKVDLEENRKVSVEDGINLAKKYNNIGFYETSAKMGDNVNVAMTTLAELTYKTVSESIEKEQAFDLQDQTGKEGVRFDCWDKLKGVFTKIMKTA
jgi:small GTP-binding protein